MPCLSQRALNGVRDSWSFGIADRVYIHDHACTGHGTFGRGCKLQAASMLQFVGMQHEQLVGSLAMHAAPCMQGQRGESVVCHGSVCGRWPW
jgi:hypothetical protein